MEKYNKFLRNITELIEKGLFTSKDLIRLKTKKRKNRINKKVIKAKKL